MKDSQAAHKVLWVQKETKVLKGIQAQRAMLALKELKDLWVIKDQRELPLKQALKDQLV